MRRWLFVILMALLALGATAVWAQGGKPESGWPSIEMPNISINGKNMTERSQVGTMLQVSFALTTLTLAPYILVMCTAFIRVTITMSFLRQALGTQQVPPTQVLMGLGLFITMYVMAPVGSKMNRYAIQPYLAGKIEQPQFITEFTTPLRNFMLAQTRDKDLQLFVNLGKMKDIKNRNDVPFYALCPAYVLSEIKTSFQIGFLLYIPFLVIDMIVSSVLMAMGMFMLSPMTISLPFKLLMFVMIDGWHLIITGLVKSFNIPP
ncbi:flagellar type III secretion system pore protein FliP [bacterium]|nr:flagellar type III secretion system pore protein FliP [bacterium]